MCLKQKLYGQHWICLLTVITELMEAGERVDWWSRQGSS